MPLYRCSVLFAKRMVSFPDLDGPKVILTRHGCIYCTYVQVHAGIFEPSLCVWTEFVWLFENRDCSLWWCRKPEHLPQPEVIPLPHEAMKPLGYIVQVLALYTPYVHIHILYKIHERTIRTSPSRCLTSATWHTVAWHSPQPRCRRATCRPSHGRHRPICLAILCSVYASIIHSNKFVKAISQLVKPCRCLRLCRTNTPIPWNFPNQPERKKRRNWMSSIFFLVLRLYCPRSIKPMLQQTSLASIYLFHICIDICASLLITFGETGLGRRCPWACMTRSQKRASSGSRVLVHYRRSPVSCSPRFLFFVVSLLLIWFITFVDTFTIGVFGVFHCDLPL